MSPTDPLPSGLLAVAAPLHFFTSPRNSLGFQEPLSWVFCSFSFAGASFLIAALVDLGFLF